MDGLRGLAALLVVLYHINVAATLSYGEWTPRAVTWLLAQGFLGVEVFFVLSGFVIAYSVRGADYTPRFLGTFALRRMIRLDPPYWLAIALETGLIWLTVTLTSTSIALPSVPQVLAHLAYAQHVTGHGDIVPVFWTLCYEIQFYLFLVGVLVLGHALRPRWPALDRLTPWLFASLFVVSLLARWQLIPAPLWLALGRWFQFFLGVLVWWVVSGLARPLWLIAAWGAVLVVVLANGRSPMQLIVIAASAVLWWAWRRDGMASVLGGRLWQGLGAISYSLYLFHSPIGWRAVRAPQLLLGITPSGPLVLAVYVPAVLIAILGSAVLWRLCELPCQAWSRRIGHHPSPERRRPGGGQPRREDTPPAG